MIEWEKTMAQDLKQFLLLHTSANLSLPFQDTIIKNKDVRELKDTDGTALLLYSFFDKNTLIITTREDSFKEIVSRLNTSSFTK